MRKFALTCAIAIGVGGCSAETMEKFNRAVQFATVGITQPVTEEHLYVAQQSMVVVFAGLNAYRRSCIQQIIPASCKDHITAIQKYTKRIPAALTTVRAFVRNNDQVNAATAFRTLNQLIDDAKGEAAKAGVPIGG